MTAPAPHPFATLALPLAFAGLPLYVLIPKWYAAMTPLSVAMMGTMLLAARLIDTFQDPWLGQFSDRFIRGRATVRRWLIALALPLMAFGIGWLLFPPALSETATALWLLFGVIVTCTAYSLATINYYALTAEIAPDYQQQTRLTAMREAYGLAGVLLASLLPVIAMQSLPEQAGLLITVVLVLLCLIGYRRFAASLPADSLASISEAGASGWRSSFANRPFRTLAGIYFLSTLAASFPAALMLFFVTHILRADAHAGGFLACYFLAGALGTPFWRWLADHLGKRLAWCVALVGSVLLFAGAYLLGEGDIVGFYTICLLSGLCLGADLALPPALLADLIAGQSQAGRYFGLWTLISKLGFALASGASLIWLGAMGFQEQGNNPPEALRTLALCYTLVPCGLRLLAVVWLWRRPELDPCFPLSARRIA